MIQPKVARPVFLIVGLAIITPVQFSINGRIVEAVVPAAVIGAVPPSFVWDPSIVDWAGPLGSVGFVVPEAARSLELFRSSLGTFHDPHDGPSLYGFRTLNRLFNRLTNQVVKIRIVKVVDCVEPEVSNAPSCAFQAAFRVIQVGPVRKPKIHVLGIDR